ncbi:ligand-binding sensor domain-containing protein/signal transduction histidine kinase/DNA-binding response OmpR family regulator [Parabacteroides sp. PH5-13]|nr:ligand-binding sensor domain-containing protein/signal transduction histidine kinase/DNA-binding response OmpR family regulator [Parabacteroides sp. PH5-39]MDH6321646.1 ligand-binding sensor domain-containing protein/signal transduction histidine kinase/DNA-binding response OmpR family regulator [Parabacteroides sp. PH5-13]MDH6325371.1 ligand-binding sensor domain-containing protein/signal transduction histidine kinase/DNA-binding response OmpR family regulator [Parabacteroides sp. PH5-8]MDH6
MNRNYKMHIQKTSILTSPTKCSIKMKQITKIILSFLFLQMYLPAHSIQYYFKHYQVLDGLSNNIINCIHQDRHGFMWFGTRDGLNRFDGYSFRIFRDNPDEFQAIGSSYIVGIAEDKEGVLWVGTYNGMFKYNGNDETFEQIPFSKGMRATDLAFDADGNLWLFLNSRLVKYTPGLDTFQPYTLPDNGTPTSFCISPQGSVWITLSNGMLYELMENGEMKGHDLFANSSQATLRNLTRAYANPTGEQIYVGTSIYGAKIFDVRTNTYHDILQEEVKKNELTVQGFLQTSEDEVWIASESGLFIYTPSTGVYSMIQKRPFDPYSLSTNSLYHLYRDHENGIWIGTYAGGINYYSPFQPFEKYYAYPAEHVMKGDLVHDICTDQYGNLWIGTEDAGVNKLDTKTGIYTNFSPSEDPYSISRMNIHGLVADGDHVWIGSLNGIELIHILTGKVIKRYELPESCQIVIMKKLPSGLLLVGTAKGAYVYDEKNDKFGLLPQSPVNNRIQSIFEDHRGTIWIGTASVGLFYYNPLVGDHGAFKLDSINSFSENVINDIIEDQQHNLWFATFAGVKKYNPQTGELIRYDMKKGMPSNTTFKILQDSCNTMWISTANGLVNLEPENGTIRVFTQDHGLITNQFNYNSAWKDNTGKMYFGMVKGMIGFRPEEIQMINRKATVYLTKMNIFDKTTGTSIPAFPISFTNHVQLGYDQSTFSIDFSSLSYIAPNITEYTFRMEGLDNNWNYLKNAHTAYYTKLSPGKYTFQVKGANVSGIWNDETAELHITVDPPWWKSTMAYTIYFLLSVILAHLIVRYFWLQNKQKMERSIKLFEDKKEKELYQAKIDFFINVAHEIRTPLTLIKSPLEKVMKDNSISTEAQGYLNSVERNANRVLNLVNQLLDFRKTELEGYRLSFIKVNITDLLNDICTRFRHTAEQQNLRFDIHSQINNADVYIDREACTKIISNMLTNALKYAETKIIIILKYSKGQDSFILDVSNDGQKISAEISEKIFEPFYRGEESAHKPGTGLGLPLARSLAKMHQGTLELIDDRSFNTFRLILPVNQPDSIRLNGEEAYESTEVSDQNLKMYHSEPDRPAILIVEDNNEMQDFVAQEVSTLYNVFTAFNGKEALHLLQVNTVQLVISDIMMPVMDGLELLKTIKMDIEYSHLPVILLTARNTDQSRLQGLELGADAYIDKPFSMDILLAQVTNLLNNRNNIRKFYFNSPIANMKSMAYSKADENFLERLNNIILENIAEMNLDVEMLADKMNMSRPTLYRKIKAISNLSPNDLIRITRLKKAAELMTKEKMKIYEVAEAVGFNSQSYFGKAFQKQFGVTPTEYIKSN